MIGVDLIGNLRNIQYAIHQINVEILDMDNLIYHHGDSDCEHINIKDIAPLLDDIYNILSKKIQKSIIILGERLSRNE